MNHLTFVKMRRKMNPPLHRMSMMGFSSKYDSQTPVTFGLETRRSIICCLPYFVSYVMVKDASNLARMQILFCSSYTAKWNGGGFSRYEYMDDETGGSRGSSTCPWGDRGPPNLGSWRRDRLTLGVIQLNNPSEISSKVDDAIKFALQINRVSNINGFSDMEDIAVYQCVLEHLLYTRFHVNRSFTLSSSA